MDRGRRVTNSRAAWAADLQSLQSLKTLRATWDATVMGDPRRPPAAPGGRLHPCFDAKIGLGLLARATIIRAIMKTELKRDYRDNDSLPSDAAWHIGLVNKTHATELFSQDALGTDPKGWLRLDAPNTANLYDLNWRSKVWSGFTAGKYHVAGLNGWFSARYRKNLAGGAMTDHLLFQTRFFGESAIDNYIRFLLQGVYVPSANVTLSQREPFSVAELANDPTRKSLVADVIAQLKTRDNRGKPIVTVSCTGSPTAGSRFATTIVTQLGKDGYSACYVPLSKCMSSEQLHDHGFRSIVEVIHRFVTGPCMLGQRMERAGPGGEAAPGPQPHGEGPHHLRVRRFQPRFFSVPSAGELHSR